jgi:hypothetical protein
MAKKNITLKKGRTQNNWDELIGDGIITRSKQPKEELDLLQARKEMGMAWLKLDMAITAYNLYLENKLKDKNK